MKRMKALFPIAAAALLCACPQPITRSHLSQAEDGVPPVVTIATPADGSYCAKTVSVSGTVSDASTEAGDPGQVVSVAYRVLSTALSGEATLSGGSAFSFEFPTTNLGPSFVLEVSAADWNGNVGTRSVTLLILTDNNIPSLAVSPGNHQATLSWGSVPHAQSFTLYYTTDGSLPSPGYGRQVDGVSSPCVLTGLPNGSLHVFRLQAHSSQGDDNWSGFVKTIPLSPQTLAPHVWSESRQVRLTWASITGEDSFEVWRSASKSGPFIMIGQVAGNEFVDKEGQDGTTYYYRIRPALAGSLTSGEMPGGASPFPVSPGIGMLFTGSSYDIAVSGGYGFVTSSDNSIRVIDLSNPEAAFVAGVIPLPSFPDKIAVSGTRAYVVGSTNLWVLDVSNPATGSVLGSTTLPSSTHDVAVRGAYAYVADGAGLKVIDVQDPVHPSVVRSVSCGSGWGVAVSGNYAYLAGNTGGLYVVDVTNPAAASLVNTITGINVADKVVAKDGVLYVSHYDSTGAVIGLRIFDISTTPSLPHELSDTVFTNYSVYSKFVVSNGFAYVPTNTGVQIVDVADPAHPWKARHVSTSGRSQGIALVGSIAFIPQQTLGTQVMDLSHPGAASLIGSIPTGGNARGAVVSGGNLYVAANTAGVRIIDLPTRTAVNTISTSAVPRHITISGNHAFFVDENYGLHIADITDPAAATIEKSLKTPGYALDVAVEGDLAYIADRDLGMHIVDVSDHSAPKILGSVGNLSGGLAVGVTIRDGYAYIADFNGGLVIADVSDPANPVIKGQGGTYPWLAWSVALCGKYAYVSTDTQPSNCRLYVFDVSNPSSPAAVGSPVDLPGANGMYVTVSGTYAYVACADGGVVIIDISKPDAPNRFKTIDTPGSAQFVGAYGRTLYVPDEGSGLQIIDLLGN